MEHHGLADKLPEQPMAQRQHEGEPTVPAVDMTDPKSTGREPAGDAQPQLADREEIMIADEMQRPVRDLDPKRDAEAAADILLEAGRPDEPLARLDHLREAAAPPVHPGPELAAERRVLGDADHRRNADLARQRKRRADHPRDLRQHPAGETHPAFDDLAGVQDGTAISHALAEPGADRLGQCRPGGLADQGPKSEVAELT